MKLFTTTQTTGTGTAGARVCTWREPRPAVRPFGTTAGVAAAYGSMHNPSILDDHKHRHRRPPGFSP